MAVTKEIGMSEEDITQALSGYRIKNDFMNKKIFPTEEFYKPKHNPQPTSIVVKAVSQTNEEIINYVIDQLKGDITDNL